MFYVGQKVECVDDTHPQNRPLGLLKAKSTYTIRWIGQFRGRLCVRVDEIIRPCGNDRTPFDTPYYSSRFRPIVERKTDISVFTQILDDVNTRAPAQERASAINLEEGR